MQGASVPKELLHLAKYTRQHYFPLQTFDGCTLLRGTIGTSTAFQENSYVLVWEKQKNDLHVGRLASLMVSSRISISKMSIVLFWAEGPASRPDEKDPTDAPMNQDSEPPHPPGSESDGQMDDRMNTPPSSSSFALAI